MIIEGLLLIQEGVNTNYMEEKLSSFLTESQLTQKGSGGGAAAAAEAKKPKKKNKEVIK